MQDGEGAIRLEDLVVVPLQEDTYLDGPRPEGRSLGGRVGVVLDAEVLDARVGRVALVVRVVPRVAVAVAGRDRGDLVGSGADRVGAEVRGPFLLERRRIDDHPGAVGEP